MAICRICDMGEFVLRAMADDTGGCRVPFFCGHFWSSKRYDEIHVVFWKEHRTFLIFSFFDLETEHMIYMNDL